MTKKKKLGVYMTIVCGFSATVCFGFLFADEAEGCTLSAAVQKYKTRKNSDSSVANLQNQFLLVCANYLSFNDSLLKKL